MELLKVKEFAAKYNLCASTVRNMCLNGDLPAAKIGVGWRIDVEKAEAILSSLIDNKGPQKRSSKRTRAVVKTRPKRDFDFATELARLRGKAV